MKKLADRFFKNRTIPACVKLNGEYEYVVVEAGYQPEEWDTNTSEGVEVFAVWHEDNGNIIDSISERDLREVETAILEAFGDYCAGHFEDKADHEMESRRDGSG